MNTKILYLLLILFALVSCSKDVDDDNGGVVNKNVNANVVTTQKEVARLEFPHVAGGNSIVVVHKTRDKYDPDGVNYSLEWDCDKKSQRWVCYQMHKYGGSTTSRSNAWAEDPDIPSYARFSNTSSMYSGSGYERGHICPSADRLYSYTANVQTFYYSNMQPQYSMFNGGEKDENGDIKKKGIWLKMEDQVRTWVATSGYDTLYVCKGGTIDREDQIHARIRNQLIVPKYFFMALLCKNSYGYKGLAFWAEHIDYVPTDFKLSNYVVNIRELENLTGIDFFCNLPDDIENSVETLGVDNIKRAWGLK